MLLRFYAQPLWAVGLELVLMLLLWSAAGRWCARDPRRRYWRLGNGLLLLPALALIAFLTLLGRRTGNYPVILRPFRTLSDARDQPELYRAMLMNVFLFVPLGLSLGPLWPRRWSVPRRLLLTMFCGLLCSVLAEALQFFLRLGRAETDDVLCNTLGTALGALPLWIATPSAKRDRSQA